MRNKQRAAGVYVDYDNDTPRVGSVTMSLLCAFEQDKHIYF